MKKTAEKEEWQRIQDEFYSSAEKHTHLVFEPDSVYVKDLTGHMVRQVPVRPSDEVLEIGAGAGRFTMHMQPFCRKIVALDTAPALLEALRRDSGETTAIETICASVFDVDSTFPPDSFETVCGFFVLHHLPDHQRLFSVLAKVMKPGARIGFIEPNRLNPSFLVQVFVSNEMNWKSEKGMFTFSASQTLRTLAACGFRHIRIERFGLFPPQILDRFPSALKVQKIIERIKPLRRLLPFVLITGEKA